MKRIRNWVEKSFRFGSDIRNCLFELFFDCFGHAQPHRQVPRCSAVPDPSCKCSIHSYTVSARIYLPSPDFREDWSCRRLNLLGRSMQGPPSQASASAPTGRAAPMQPGATVAAPPLRVLFLDVDGVVCCNQNGQLEPDKMQQLLRITKEASAKVCLSSNWRLYEELREHLYTKLGAMGIECIGTTPDAGEATHGEGMRPCEIGAWIRFWHEDKGRQRVTSFVAVDDRPLLQEKGGSVLRGAPSPPHHLIPPPRSVCWHTRPTCRRRDAHARRSLRADQPGARLDGARCHAHHRPAARQAWPDRRLSTKPQLRHVVRAARLRARHRCSFRRFRRFRSRHRSSRHATERPRAAPGATAQAKARAPLRPSVRPRAAHAALPTHWCTNRCAALRVSDGPRAPCPLRVEAWAEGVTSGTPAARRRSPDSGISTRPLCRLGSARQLHAAVMDEPHAAEHDASPDRDAHRPSIGPRRPIEMASSNSREVLTLTRESSRLLPVLYRLTGVFQPSFFPLPCSVLARLICCCS